MADSEKKRAKAWLARLKAADDAYDDWSDDFRVEDLEDYYSGIGHHKHLDADEAKKQYTINLCFSTLETKLPALMYFRPAPQISPRPPRSGDAGSTLPARAALMQDTVMQAMGDDRVGFDEAVDMGLKDAHYGFGVVEVGYEADIVENPNAGKPQLNDHGEPITEAAKEEGGEPVPVPQPDELVRNENIYLKHIPFDQFRVPAMSHNMIERNDWVAYYEWVRLQDIKANKNYAKRDKVKAKGKLIDERKETRGYHASMEEDKDLTSMVKLWKIWDIRTMVKHVIAEDHDFFLQEDRPVTVLPFPNPLKFHRLRKQFYPVPPLFNWLSPQDELNETRNQQRVHRRRFNRRYTALQGKVEPDEMQKIEQGGDGAVAWIKAPDAVRPIEDAPLDRSVALNVPMTREDFMNISAVGGDQRGSPEATTATQAQIVQSNSMLRDNQYRSRVAKWLGEIVKIMLIQMRENLSLGYWIRTNVDPQSMTAPMETQHVEEQWRLIQASDLGDLDFDVKIDVENLSPVTEETRKQQWGQTLQLLSNPAVSMILSASEPLLRKTLGFQGIRSDQEIADIRQAMLLVVQMAGMQQKPPAEGPGIANAPGVPSPPGPPGAPGPGAGPVPPSGPPSLGPASVQGSPPGRPS